MAELKDVAEQFAKDLADQNIGGLMMVFTPAGMGKAMAVQAQVQAAGPRPPSTGYEVDIIGQDGDDKLVEITLKDANGGEGVLVTRWKDVAGSWRVDDISLK